MRHQLRVLRTSYVPTASSKRAPVRADSDSNIGPVSVRVKRKKQLPLVLDDRDTPVDLEHHQAALLQRCAAVLAQGLEEVLVGDAFVLQALFVDVAAVDEDPGPAPQHLLHLA